MATIYRFIVEQKTSSSSTKSGNKNQTNAPSKKSAAKKGRWVSIFGGEKGGVEHNRKMRAINPLLNKMTGGYWEKGMRLGRAGAGLITRNTETGKLGLSGPAIAIIIAFIINAILKWQNHDRTIAEQRNNQNYKMLENSSGAVRGQYEIVVNQWNGRQTYKQNK